MDRRSRAQLPLTPAPRPSSAPTGEEDSNTNTREETTGTDRPSVGYYVAWIKSEWRTATASLIETGRILIEAKKNLDHGEFGPMIRTKLPFGERTAEKLMAIARHPIISNPTHESHLPPRQEALYLMTRLPLEELEKMLADGTINPNTERKHVEKILLNIRKDGLDNTKNLYDAIEVLQTFRNKWREPTNLAARAVDDDGVDLEELPLLSPWIEKFNAAAQRAKKVIVESVEEED
jgi:hypothetical protein